MTPAVCGDVIAINAVSHLPGNLTGMNQYMDFDGDYPQRTEQSTTNARDDGDGSRVLSVGAAQVPLEIDDVTDDVAGDAPTAVALRDLAGALTAEEIMGLVRDVNRREADQQRDRPDRHRGNLADQVEVVASAEGCCVILAIDDRGQRDLALEICLDWPGTGEQLAHAVAFIAERLTDDAVVDSGTEGA